MGHVSGRSHPSKIKADVGHALFKPVVPEPAPGGAPRQADGGAGRLCHARRRGEGVCRHSVAGEWNEAPVFQRIYGRWGSGPERGAEPRQAVEEALELLHEDYAYEFQIGWSLWELETGNAGPSTRPAAKAAGLAQDDNPNLGAQDDIALGRWVREPRLVRVTGFGPLFDEGAYEQDGHIRVEFGSDAPFLEEDAELDHVGAKHIEENVRQLVALTRALEKTPAQPRACCGANWAKASRSGWRRGWEWGTNMVSRDSEEQRRPSTPVAVLRSLRMTDKKRFRTAVHS